MTRLNDNSEEPVPAEELADEVNPDEEGSEFDIEEEDPNDCVDCGDELEFYEDKICLDCENKRNRQHGVDDFM